MPRGQITAKADQLARQCRMTRAMLPYASVSGLGQLDDEVLVAIFGLTMRIRNELPDMERFSVENLPLENVKTVEGQRAYWRRRQRECRARKRAQSNFAQHHGTNVEGEKR